MNEQEYMNITSKIDEKYVVEYKVIEAKRNITLRKRIRTAIVVAAALAVMVPVSVIAYSKLTHRDKVSVYYSEDGVRAIEENMAMSGFTVENGKIRLTVDTMMCDGNYVEGVYTLTALTEDAKEHLDNAHKYRCYADNGEEIWCDFISESMVSDAKTENEISYYFQYPLRASIIDDTRPTRIVFCEEIEYTGIVNDFNDLRDYTYYEGIYYDLLSEPNVPTKTLCSEDGTELTLSPFSLNNLDKYWDFYQNERYAEEMIESFVFITTDGERYDFFADLGIDGMFSATNGVSPEQAKGLNLLLEGHISSGNFYFKFGTAFDVENISGVEINGVAYMEEK
ncbi:MAG: hypothetical protein IK109_08390 [Clostridiales bacterium]|nr:hypothetical protein [Clostridiales bacterium]